MSDTTIATLRAMLANLDDAKKYQSLRDVMSTLPAPDLAAVFEDLPPEKMPVLFRLCPKDLAAEIFAELTPESQQNLIDGLTDKELKAVVDDLFVDDATDLVEEMPANVVKKVLQNADEGTRKTINQFLNYPENSAERIVTLTQYPPADSHETGYVFFEDDFAWVTENWVEPYSKYGWPGVKTDGVNNNEFGLTNAKIKPVADEKGYTYSASVYARYEGSVKLGKTNQCGFLQTPALSKIDAGKSATVLVSFYGALYASASGNADSAKPAFPISIEGGGTIGNGSETETAIVMDNHFCWTQYSFVIRGATSKTRIKFGDEDTKTYRIHLDNFRVEKAEETISP